MGIGVGTIKKVGSSILSSGKATKLGGGAFAVDTAMNLQGGDNLGTSVLKAGVTGALASSNPGLFFLGTAASLAQEGYWGLQQFNYQKKQWWNKQYATNNVVGGNYVDTQRALTMRQASAQAIQGSKMNARSALGGEAKLLNPYATRRY
ncbi:hypothetical protein [Bacillus cereus]|uniref:hypothetical protein n=1 Tax=Bacillus mycoides TaxID=1405 RepID=UPI00032F2A86|nr:hypothetical protein IKK_06115 [Bacillus mycoides]